MISSKKAPYFPALLKTCSEISFLIKLKISLKKSSILLLFSQFVCFPKETSADTLMISFVSPEQLKINTLKSL